MKKLIILFLLISGFVFANIPYAGGTYVDTTFTADGTKQTTINSVVTNLNTAGWTTINGLFSGTYTSGGSITGTVGQTCTLTTFNNGNSGGTATVALTGTNTIAGGTALVITAIGTGSTSASTSATLGNGTATCSGTATVSTVISLAGTLNVLLRSAVTTAGSLQVDIRIKDNGGNGTQLYLEDVGFTLKPGTYDTIHGSTLLSTNGIIYRVIATKFQAIVTSDSANANGRQFSWFGMPYLPAPAIGQVTGAGFLIAGSAHDGDNIRSNPAQYPGISNNNLGNNPSANFELILNSSYYESANQYNSPTVVTGAPRLLLGGQASDQNYTFASPTAYRWFGTNAVLTSDVLIAYGTSSTSEAFVIGQIYDCFYLADAVVAGTAMTFGGHSYRTITNSYSGQQSVAPRGGLWFATN